MRGFLLFVSGILVGTAIQTLVAQSPAGNPAVRLNHVAISVPDVAQAVAWYGEKLGFREVVRNTSPQGQVTGSYIQKLFPSGADVPVRKPGYKIFPIQVVRDLLGDAASQL